MPFCIGGFKREPLPSINPTDSDLPRLRGEIKMYCLKRSYIIACMVLLVCAACSTKYSMVNEQQIVDTVWLELELNTISHDRTAWEIITLKVVTGLEVQNLFEDAHIYCGFGPEPKSNRTILHDASYWYVEMKPRAATPIPQPTEDYSPTAPPWIPEPFIDEVHFLADYLTGRIVARNFHCIKY